RELCETLKNHTRLNRLISCQTIHPRLNKLIIAPERRTVNRATIPLIMPILDRKEFTNPTMLAA
ncbi:MAG: hypothetical protein M3Q00_06915, partial [Pseudomonadota bacterium]|nr:hypothetical protein [Pseudomonadota bacterium]